MHQHLPRRAAVGALLTATILCTLLLATTPSGAAARCTVRTLTDGVTGDNVQLGANATSTDGRTTAFLSDADYLGTNPDGSEEVWHRA
ncbi:hypothetical protein B7486_57695, partial [cyanobacterium TDX16]